MNVTAKFREWNRLAYISSAEKRLNRSLWALLVVAVGYALTHHVWLVNVPAFVRWGPGFGVVCYDLAIAYTSAFTFYALNIRLPLRRDRRNIYATVGPLVGLVVMHGNQLMTALNKVADIEPPDRENTWENIKEMCSKISSQHLAPAEGTYVANQGILPHTVFSVIVDRMNRTRTGIEQILSFSPYLATDLIDLLSAIETHSHFRTFTEHMTIMASTGLAISNPDMSLWAHQIFNYAKLIHDLDSYARRYLPTMTYQNRPGLMSAPARVTATERSAVTE
jgi:hypothetical protein